MYCCWIVSIFKDFNYGLLTPWCAWHHQNNESQLLILLSYYITFQSVALFLKTCFCKFFSNFFCRWNISDPAHNAFFSECTTQTEWSFLRKLHNLLLMIYVRKELKYAISPENTGFFLPYVMLSMNQNLAMSKFPPRDILFTKYLLFDHFGPSLYNF